jgi:hypothetical protein
MNPASHGHHDRGGSTDSATAQTSTASNSEAVDVTAVYSSSWLA